jgi:hypothetical protein
MPPPASGKRGRRVQAQEAHGTAIALDAQSAARRAILAQHTDEVLIWR